MSCPYTTPAPSPVKRQRYSLLHSDGRRLIRQWLSRASTEMQSQDGSPFEAFIFLWIAFNGYASCITDEEQDREIIRKLGNCPDTRRDFAELLDRDADFQSLVSTFAKSWPVFKVHQLRRQRLLGRAFANRAERVRYYLDADCRAYRPECFSYHQGRQEDVPLDWPHTLNAIYQVRCNLFHGEKSLTEENDRVIVTQALGVLRTFIVRCQLIEA